MRDVIAFDVDDIFFEFYLALTLFHNERYGTRLRKEDFRSYFVHEVWGGTAEEGVAKVWEFYGTEEFRYLPLVRGAEHAVRCLAEKYDLVAVTGRPHGLAGLTTEMLGRHFSGCFKSVHHTDAFGIGGGVPQPKVDVCFEVGARTIVEDYLGHALPCADAGMDVILFDQPWNRGVAIPTYVNRAHSWADVLAFLL